MLGVSGYVRDMILSTLPPDSEKSSYVITEIRLSLFRKSSNRGFKDSNRCES
jgi:hypothetical protein